MHQQLITKIKILTLALSFGLPCLAMGVGNLASAPVYADPPPINQPVTAQQQAATGTPTSNPLKGDACAGLNQLDTTTKADCSNLGTQGNGFSSTVKTVVEVLSWVVGVVSIIMILVSGLKYITSGGDSNKVGAAKSTLIYAIIGLVIAVSAQFLVRLIVTQANNNTPGSCQYNSAYAATDSRCKPSP